MDMHRIPRDGRLDLKFTGELIGGGKHGTGGSSGYSHDWTCGTDVEIYLTGGGAFVTAVKQWSRWQGEGEVYRAAVHTTPDEALDWLVEDCGGTLGPASKEAWEQACGHPILDGRDVEVVT